MTNVPNPSPVYRGAPWLRTGNPSLCDIHQLLGPGHLLKWILVSLPCSFRPFVHVNLMKRPHRFLLSDKSTNLFKTELCHPSQSVQCNVNIKITSTKISFSCYICHSVVSLCSLKQKKNISCYFLTAFKRSKNKKILFAGFKDKLTRWRNGNNFWESHLTWQTLIGCNSPAVSSLG